MRTYATTADYEPCLVHKFNRFHARTRSSTTHNPGQDPLVSQVRIQSGKSRNFIATADRGAYHILDDHRAMRMIWPNTPGAVLIEYDSSVGRHPLKLKWDEKGDRWRMTQSWALYQNDRYRWSFRSLLVGLSPSIVSLHQ